MSLSREWWECECLALRLSASAAVSVLPRRVNLPGKQKGPNGQKSAKTHKWGPKASDGAWQDGCRPAGVERFSSLLSSAAHLEARVLASSLTFLFSLSLCKTLGGGGGGSGG